MARVVLVESYYGGSHRAWADGWKHHSRHEISLVTHPDEFWRWRLRGGAVTLAERLTDHVDEHDRPDAVVVSSMVDVAALCGLARRPLRGVPIAVYVHESQQLYPLAPNQRPDSWSALVNWRSLVAADALWFNSGFHRDALREALPVLLDAQPSPSHHHLLPGVFDRSRVLWPGVETSSLIAATRSGSTPPLVLWNQRWDHDKNPQAVFGALAELADEDVPFRLALAGENHGLRDAELAWIHERLGPRIVHSGHLPLDAYRRLLLQSDVVVSAADHEFFGMAFVEAMAAGVVPVVPGRLSFPELIEPRWHPNVLYPEGGLLERLRSTLTELDQVRGRITGLRESMARFDVVPAAAAHDQAIDELVALA